MCPAAHLHVSDTGSTGYASASGSQKALWGAPKSSLWLENNTASCPDVNDWGRLRLANQKQCRRKHTAAVFHVFTLHLLSTLYKYTFGSARVPWCVSDKIRAFFCRPKTLKSAMTSQKIPTGVHRFQRFSPALPCRSVY